MPEAKARIMDADLRRIPGLLHERDSLRSGVRSMMADDAALRRALIAKDTAIAATQRRVNFKDALYLDALAQATQWKYKAKKRGLIIYVGVGIPAAYGTYRGLKALKILP